VYSTLRTGRPGKEIVIVKLRRSFVVAVALVGLAVGVSGALADPPPAPVPLFTIPAGQCPQLGPDVSVEGQGFIRNVDHGSNFTQFASGTAIDSNGNTYKFNYHLSVSENAKRVILTDHFNLVGGSGQTIHATFVARFDANGVFFISHGDPISDPITFTAVCDAI
jgi:hypothetical protein